MCQLGNVITNKTLYISVFESVIEFKRNSRFSGSIHEVGTDPLLVHYWTGHKLTFYKDLC